MALKKVARRHRVGHTCLPMAKNTVPDTSRDERILSKLRSAMSGWLEVVSIAYALRSPEAAIFTALRRLESDGKVISRTVRRHVASRPVTEWSMKS